MKTRGNKKANFLTTPKQNKLSRGSNPQAESFIQIVVHNKETIIIKYIAATDSHEW
jgi:hypothetical protein